MKNILIGIVIGILLSLAIFIPIRKQTIVSYHSVGFNDGKIRAYAEVAKIIEKEFGIYDGKSEYKNLFSVKTTRVIVIEENGRKTIKVIP